MVMKAEELKEYLDDLSRREKVVVQGVETNEKFEHIASSIGANKKLQKLEVHFNGLDIDHDKIFSRIFNNESLIECSIFVHSGDLTSKVIKSLSKHLKLNNRILWLILDIGCMPAKDAIVSLAECLGSHKSIEFVKLHFCSGSYAKNVVDNESILHLAKMIETTQSIKMLEFDDVPIGSEGFESFGTALAKNKSITRLVLDCFNVGARGAKALSLALTKNATLLDLGFNLRPGLSTLLHTLPAIEALCEFFKHNTTLTHLCILGVVEPEAAQYLARMLKDNFSIKSLQLQTKDTVAGRSIRETLQRNQSNGPPNDAVERKVSQETRTVEFQPQYSSVRQKGETDHKETPSTISQPVTIDDINLLVTRFVEQKMAAIKGGGLDKPTIFLHQEAITKIQRDLQKLNDALEEERLKRVPSGAPGGPAIENI